MALTELWPGFKLDLSAVLYVEFIDNTEKVDGQVMQSSVVTVGVGEQVIKRMSDPTNPDELAKVLILASIGDADGLLAASAADTKAKAIRDKF